MTLSVVMLFYIKSQRHNTRKKEGLNKNLLKLITSAPQKSESRESEDGQQAGRKYS